MVFIWIFFIDIKTQNIFIEKIERPTSRTNYIIGDFDSAKIFTDEDPPKETIGTPCYMAPEIIDCKNKIEYTIAADGK